MATILKSDFDDIFKRLADRAREEAIAFLWKMPYFQHWSKAMINKVVGLFRPRTFKREAVIIEEGMPLEERCIYLIKSGDFALSKRVKVNEAEIIEKRTLEPLQLLDMRQVQPTPEPAEFGDQPTPKYDIDETDTQPLIQPRKV